MPYFQCWHLTTGSILYGYVTDSLPESLLSNTDKAAILGLKKNVFATRIVPWPGRRWFACKWFFYCCVRRNPPTRRPSIPRDQRVDAVTRFILGFSDQQLATGLAILVASLANRCHLTLYKHRVVFCLAWFSVTTHLGTLKVLREYFYEYGVVRNWRVIGIFAFLILLFISQIFLILGVDGYGIDDPVNPATPLQCIIDGRTCPSNFSWLSILVDLSVVLFLLVSYISFTWDLFTDPRTAQDKKLGKAVVHLQAVARRAPDSDRKELFTNSIMQEQFIGPHNSKLKVRDSPGNVRAYRHSFLWYPRGHIQYGLWYVPGYQRYMVQWHQDHG
jgi:hypothetical protein